MINEEKYLEWMEEYFNSPTADENIDIKKTLVDCNEDGILMLIWGSASYGRLGASVRNYMREYHPEIDDDFPNYCDFEDYSWELFNKLIEKWEGRKN
jgi:hypothetical protein